MKERQEVISPYTFPAETPSALIRRISDTKKQINEVKSRVNWKPGVWIPDADYKHLGDLSEKINDDLVCLLSLRRGTSLEQEIPVEVDIFPGEEIHPFSINRIVIVVPSVDRPGSTYRIFANLNDLRGESTSDSVEAMALIGGNETRVNNNIGAFLTKTEKELKRVNYEINLANKGKSKYSLEQLHELAKKLFRQKQLRHFPQTSL